MFRQHFEKNQLHDQVHLLFPEEDFKNEYYPDESCTTCYPVKDPNTFFQNFWNWYQTKYFTLTHTSKI